MNSFRRLGRLITHLTFLAGVSSAIVTAQYGCTSSNWASCNDPVPATYLSGSWIEDDSASEWTLTANNGTPGSAGTVSGSVMVFPIAGNCPVINYTASGSYTPTTITDNVTGSTSFTFTASSPSPATPCGGYTPVSSLTISGAIANKGNDTTSRAVKSMKRRQARAQMVAITLRTEPHPIHHSIQFPERLGMWAIRPGSQGIPMDMTRLGTGQLR